MQIIIYPYKFGDFFFLRKQVENSDLWPQCLYIHIIYICMQGGYAEQSQQEKI